MKNEHTQVLIIGGGPVGLSTSILLAQQGIESILVEKHPTTANHPKASYFNVRTMEVLKRVGVADDVYASAGVGASVSFYTSLCGHKLGSISAEAVPDYVESLLSNTPAPGCISSQIVLERLLKQHAEKNEAVTVLFEHENVALEQTQEGVEAEILDRSSGERFNVTADFAIACDGAGSPTRERLGRHLLGPPPFADLINVYIEADIESLVDVGQTGHQALYWIAHPEAAGVFIGLGGDWKKWCFNFGYSPEQGERAEDFDEARCLELIHKALGTDRLPVKILSVLPWKLCGQVVDQYREGRIFLAGDAAHLNIPTGGFGFNTGMQETHNLAWKLAYVLKGWAPQTLLDTYHSERRPIAYYNVEVSRENAQRIASTGAVLGRPATDVDEIDLDTPRGQAQREARSAHIAEQRHHFLFLGQEIGFGYWDSPIIAPDGTPHYVEEHGIEDPIYSYVPNARPGSRAPHCWLAHQESPDERFSIHELFTTDLVCLSRGDGGAWRASAEGREAGVPLSFYSVGNAGDECDLIDVDGKWSEYYGIPECGVVLVRPDGHVAWRARTLPEHHTGLPLERALRIAIGASKHA